MPGFETNITNAKNDASVAKSPLPLDTAKQIAFTKDSVIQSSLSKDKKATETTVKKKNTSQKTKYDIHDNKFDAPVMIGDGNTQTNNFGDVPKEPNTQDLLQITSQIPKKTDTIELRQSTTNEKNKVFCQKLAYKLVQIGYVNIRLDDKAVHMGIESAGIHVMPPIDNTHIVWVDCNY